MSESMYLESPTLSEIINSLQSLNANKAVGHDNIPPYFLKVAVFTIAPFLHLLVEFAFDNGLFLEACKTAKVVPIHKKGDKNDLFNYRLISILKSLSKIFEKLIYKRLFKFLDKHDVLIPEQYGFQKNISTAHAILDVVTATFDNVNNKLYSGIFFLI